MRHAAAPAVAAPLTQNCSWFFNHSHSLSTVTAWPWMQLTGSVDVLSPQPAFSLCQRECWKVQPPAASLEAASSPAWRRSALPSAAAFSVQACWCWEDAYKRRGEREGRGIPFWPTLIEVGLGTQATEGATPA